jgi:hypothetical protein
MTKSTLRRQRWRKFALPELKERGNAEAIIAAATRILHENQELYKRLA